jgi:hypothetical protein
MAKTLISRSNGMREISSIRMVLFIAVLIIFVFPSGNIAREGGRPADSGLESRWMEILKIAGADPPEGAKADAVLGPLPSDDELKSGGGLSTGEFIDAFNSPNAARGLMRDFARARLRELGRRGFLDSVAVEAVLGPEPRGVSGSRFFMIPPIPGDSFQTLIDYILAAALAVPGGDYMPSLDDRLKIDRALQASFAISSPRVRMQYMDFDVVWTTAQRHDLALSSGQGFGRPRPASLASGSGRGENSRSRERSFLPGERNLPYNAGISGSGNGVEM